MPNHFHFLIEIRNREEVYPYFLSLKPENHAVKPEDFQAPDFVMQQFSNLFNSYAKSYNKACKRRGALFNDYLRRKVVDQEKYFSTLVYYIHSNPIHHKFCREIGDWEFTSYNSLVSDKPTRLEREQTVGWFGNSKEFADYHSSQSRNWKPEEMTELEFF